MFSAAWVLPSLIGPVIAGVVVEALGWRWVFHGVALLAVPSALLILWATRHGEDRTQAETQSTIHTPSVAAQSAMETPSAAAESTAVVQNNASPAGPAQ